MSNETSKNERAERLMGRRPQGVVPFDMPCGLGFRCPVCMVPAFTPGDEECDERLHWSEYNGFLWCEVCDFDYPSILCFDLTLTPDPERPWIAAGREAAADLFLDQIAAAIDHAAPASTEKNG